jgi:hypothetical protein
VSFLAAPAFAAAMVERQVIGTIPVGRRVLLIAEVPVGDGTGLNRLTVHEVEQRFEVRVIGLQRRTEQRLDWQPSADHQLVPRDRLMVVATRSGLGQILAGSISSGL